MPHFAYCPGGIVQKVERLQSAVMTDPDGHESEPMGQEFLAGLYPGTVATDYVLTHYPVNQPTPYPRGKYAGIGDTWDGERFTSPVPPNPEPAP